MFYRLFKGFRYGVLVALISIGLLSIVGTGGGGSSDKSNDDADQVQFTLGNPETYTVSPYLYTEIPHDASGGTIIFPEGGDGTLTVTPVTGAPDIDLEEGTAFLIEFSGDSDFQITFPRSDEEEPLVWIYGIPVDPVDYLSDDEVKDAQWMPLVPLDTTSFPAVFDLYNPGEPAENVIVAATVRTPQNRPSHSYYLYYQNALKYNNWAWKRSTLLWNMTTMTIDDIWNILPSSVQTQKLSDYSSALRPSGASSGWSSGYIAFRYLAGLYRTRNPHFWYNVYGSSDAADEAVVAHECGHYISHLLLGDDQYVKLQNQRKDPHDLADVHTNRDMLEEYAFFGDYFKNGDLLYKKYNIVNASQFFKWKRAEKDSKQDKDINPASYNWPNLEGFGCFLLARLHTDKTEIVSHADINQNESIPVFELDFTTLYGYLAKGPLTTDELYDYVESSFTSDQKAKLAVMVEKMGWSYNGCGIIVDSKGDEVSGAMVENVSDYSEWETYKNSGSAQTGSDGKFTISRVYPGKSKLRVKYNSKNGTYLNSKDFDIDISKGDPTNVSQDFKTLVVDAVESSTFNFTSAKIYIELNNSVFNYGTSPYNGYELCSYADHNDVGSVYFPSEQGKEFQGSITGNEFKGSCSSSLSGPGTGNVTITFKNNFQEIESFSLTFSNGYSDMSNFTIVSADVSGGNYSIPRTYYLSGYKAEFQVTGNEHKYITSLNYSIECRDFPGKTYELSYTQSSQTLLLIRFE